MRHKISYEDFDNWLKDCPKVMFASSTENGGKRLYANIHGGFEVHHRGKKVWEGHISVDAIDKYNSL